MFPRKLLLRSMKRPNLLSSGSKRLNPSPRVRMMKLRLILTPGLMSPESRKLLPSQPRSRPQTRPRIRAEMRGMKTMMMLTLTTSKI